MRFMFILAGLLTASQNLSAKNDLEGAEKCGNRTSECSNYCSVENYYISSTNDNQRNKSVFQYSHKTNRHPLRCSKEHSVGASVYFAPVLTMTSGQVAGDNTLGGLDLGVKITSLNTTCWDVQWEFNTYIDVRAATFISTGEGEDMNEWPTTYSAQLTLAPGIRFGRVALDLGPYLAYSAYKLENEESINSFQDFFSADVSGLEAGLRAGITFHLRKVQLGLHYDKALTNQNNQFRKDDVLLTIGTQF